jgi:gas vesicle protein
MARDGLLRFLSGVGMGVGIGMLFAPKSGDRTRDLLKGKADEGKEYLKRRSAELCDSATDIIESGKEAIGCQKAALAAGLAAGKEAYGEAGGQPAPSEGQTVA